VKNSTSLTQIALQKFKKNFWGVFSLGFLALCVLVAIFAYALAPDNSENANQMHLSIHSKNPGFSVKMLTIPIAVESQNPFSVFFFGKKNADTEVPISKYSLTENSIEIIEYTPDGTDGLQKEYALSLFPKTNSVDEIPIHFGKKIPARYG